jgi:hypothetical protein
MKRAFYINDTQRKGWSDKNTRLKTPKMLSRVKMSTMLAIDRKVSSLRRQSRATSTVYHSQSFNARVPKNKKLVLDNVAFHKSKIVKSVAEDRDIDLCLHLPIVHGSIRSSLHSVIKTRYRRLNVHTLVVWKH